MDRRKKNPKTCVFKIRRASGCASVDNHQRSSTLQQLLTLVCARVRLCVFKDTERKKEVGQHCRFNEVQKRRKGNKRKHNKILSAAR